MSSKRPTQPFYCPCSSKVDIRSDPWHCLDCKYSHYVRTKCHTKILDALTDALSTVGKVTGSPRLTRGSEVLYTDLQFIKSTDMTTYLLDAVSVNPTAAKYLSLCHLGSVDRASSMVEAEKRRTYENVETHPLNKHIFFAIELTGRLGKAAHSFLKESGLSDKRQRQLRNELASIVAFSNGECIAAINAQGSTHPPAEPTDTEDYPQTAYHTHDNVYRGTYQPSPSNPYLTKQSPPAPLSLAPKINPDQNMSPQPSNYLQPNSHSGKPHSPPRNELRALSSPQDPKKMHPGGLESSSISPKSGIENIQKPPISPIIIRKTETHLPTSDPLGSITVAPISPQFQRQMTPRSRSSSPIDRKTGIGNSRKSPISSPNATQEETNSPTVDPYLSVLRATPSSQIPGERSPEGRTSSPTSLKLGIGNPQTTHPIPLPNTNGFLTQLEEDPPCAGTLEVTDQANTQVDSPNTKLRSGEIATNKTLCRDVIGWDNTSLTPSLTLMASTPATKKRPLTLSDEYSPMGQEIDIGGLTTPRGANHSLSIENLIDILEEMVSPDGKATSDLEGKKERPI